jgi:peptide/nickel transport system substrate-binding protein
MTLVRWSDDLVTPEEYLARDWDYNPGEGTLTFFLRDDVWWHDGVKTTAEDVAFTFLRATAPETGFANPSYFDAYQGGSDGVEVIDSFTVRFKIDAHIEPLDSWRATPILPAHLLADVPSEELAAPPYGTQCPVGNGPFRFVSHQQDAQWEFEANPAFPAALGGRPFLDGYIYRIIPDPTTLVSSLLAGDLDMAVPVSPSQVDRIETGAEAHVEVFPTRNIEFIVWNARRPQFADARVRQALTLAIDRAEFLEQMFGGYGAVIEGSIPPGLWQHAAFEGLGLGSGVDSAVTLFEAAGFIDRDGDGVRENEDGVRLEGTMLYNVESPARKDIAEFAQARLAEVGVQMQPEGVQMSVLGPMITDVARDFDAFALGITTDFRLDDRDLFHSQRLEGGYAFSGTQDSELDRLLDTLQVVGARADAEPLWREYAERLVAVQPYTFLYSPERILGVRERLLDVQSDERGVWVNVARWRIAPESR